MGLTCSKCKVLETQDKALRSSKGASRQDSPDPAVYDLMRRSVAYSQPPQKQQHSQQQRQSSNNNNSSASSLQHSHSQQQQSQQQQPQHKTQPPPYEQADGNEGQNHLMYKQQKKEKLVVDPGPVGQTTYLPPTRLLVRRHSLRPYEEGLSGTHIYAIRYPTDQPMLVQKEMAPPTPQHRQVPQQEQAPQPHHSHHHHHSPQSQLSPSHSHHHHHLRHNKRNFIREDNYKIPSLRDGESVDHLFRSATMVAQPRQQVVDWVTVSEEHSIYVADVGLTSSHCDRIVQVTEHVCRGQYAAYTYAKQTLGCREFPTLAAVCQPAIHTMTHAILEFSQNRRLVLDDREPHMVKYDVTKKERQKLDMHTDKSEWTYLIALSNGSGIDYEGGGTYFECLDATVHIQRGHALVFPGKLRHCGQRITGGLRFLLVAFLVDKNGAVKLKSDPSSAPLSPSSSPASELDPPMVAYHANVP